MGIIAGKLAQLEVLPFISRRCFKPDFRESCTTPKKFAARTLSGDRSPQPLSPDP